MEKKIRFLSKDLTDNGTKEVQIIKIKVKEGEEIKQQQVLYEVEGGKASEEIISEFSGKITKIFKQEGENLKLNDVFALVTSEDEEERETEQVSKQKKTPQQVVNEVPKEVESEVLRENIKTLPRVRKLAKENNIDLSNLESTLVGGARIITEETVMKAISEKKEEKERKITSESQSERVKVFEVSPRRKVIAENMVHAVSEIPHVTLMLDVNAENLVKLRNNLKEIASFQSKKVKLTYLAFFVKALAKLLLTKEFCFFNAHYDQQGKRILVYKTCNVGIAVDTEEGLVVPVIKNAEEMHLFEIASKIVELAEKARGNKLGLSEMKGSTFTITNFGSAGIKYGTPIINRPETAILGIGLLEERIVIENNVQKKNLFFPLSLSIDHRVIDGAPAGKFLTKLKTMLEGDESFNLF